MRLNLFPNKDEFLKTAEKYNVVPICSEILADTETPVSILQKIRPQHQGNMFLLESVEGGEKWARYSIIGRNPSTVIKSNGEETEMAS